MSLGTNIKNIRKSLNLSQEYVANQLQVSRQAVSKWETGQSEPSTNNLIRLAELFSCDVKDLLSSEEIMKEMEPSNNKQSTMPLLNVAGIIFFFVCFVASMLYGKQRPLLAISGILGLTGMSTLITNLVVRNMKNKNR